MITCKYQLCHMLQVVMMNSCACSYILLQHVDSSVVLYEYLLYLKEDIITPEEKKIVGKTTLFFRLIFFLNI